MLTVQVHTPYCRPLYSTLFITLPLKHEIVAFLVVLAILGRLFMFQVPQGSKCKLECWVTLHRFTVKTTLYLYNYSIFSYSRIPLFKLSPKFFYSHYFSLCHYSSYSSIFPLASRMQVAQIKNVSSMQWTIRSQFNRFFVWHFKSEIRTRREPFIQFLRQQRK